MINLYLHKNIIKKIKRNYSLLNNLCEFIAKYEEYVTTEYECIKLIDNGVYHKRLIYLNEIVFDISQELSLIIWDIYEKNNNHKIRSQSNFTYKYRDENELIEGNPFIKKNISYESISQTENLLNDMVCSKNIELDYCLDKHQQDVLYKFMYEFKNNQAISGPAGAGKTLMLHRLAYESILQKNPFVYIAFTSTLKDKFTDFVTNAVSVSRDVSQTDININDYAYVYTYEEFLREYLSPKLGIDSIKYITFSDCSSLVKAVFEFILQKSLYMFGWKNF